MRSTRLGRLAALAAVVALAAPAVAEGNEVTNWNRIATSKLGAFPLLAGGAPPALQINMAISRVPSTTRSTRLSGGISRISSGRRSTRWRRRTRPSRAPRAASLPTSSRPCPRRSPFRIGRTCWRRRSPSTRRHSPRFPIPRSRARGSPGGAAADAMIAARQEDGRFRPSPWVPNDEPGHWQPLRDPVTLLPLLPPTPWVGGVRAFLAD